MMKMKNIVAVLTALSVLSGCAGNTANDEAVTTMGTTTKVVTVETTSSAETSEKKTAVPPWELTKPESQTEETTTITTLTAEAEIVPIEIVEYRVLYDEPPEIDALGALLASSFEELRTKSFDPTDFLLLMNSENENPSTSIIKGWGCYPSAFIHASATTGLLESDGINYGDYLMDLTGLEIEKVYEYVDNGIPVAVWVTKHLTKPEPQITLDSGEVLYGEKDCVILVGYNSSSVMYWSILEEEYITYRKDFFERRYEEMGSMALTVVKE